MDKESTDLITKKPNTLFDKILNYTNSGKNKAKDVIDEAGDVRASYDAKQKRTELVLFEAEALSEARASQFKELAIEKDIIKRIEIKSRISDTARAFNELSVLGRIFPELDDDDIYKAEASEDAVEENLTWFERFLEYAGQENESWRKDLLAKAFILKMKGERFSLDTLFKIGTLPKNVFDSFSHSLNLCAITTKGLCLLGDASKWNDHFTSDCKRYGSAIYVCYKEGLIVENGSINPTSKGEVIRLHYLDENDVFEVLTDDYWFPLQGVTRNGKELSKLYLPVKQDLGSLLYKDKITSISKNDKLKKINLKSGKK